MKDLHSNISPVVAIGPAELDADSVSAAIDLQGFSSASLILMVGVGGITFDDTNKVEFKLTHSDDDDSYDAVVANDVLGAESVAAGGIVKSLEAEHAAAAVYRFGYKGGRRFLKFQADFSGTHGTGTPIAAIILRGHGHDLPIADQA